MLGSAGKAPQAGRALRARLLGTFSVEVDGVDRTAALTGRTRSLLQLLLVRDAPVPRDVLLDTFWPHLDPARARNNLNVTVTALRRALDDRDRSAIAHAHGCYRIDSNRQRWLDTEAFERHVRRGHAFEGDHDLKRATQEYQAAIDLYGGDLLAEEPYADWLTADRAFYRRVHRDAVERLARLLLAEGRHGAVAWTCHAALRRDPDDPTLLELWTSAMSALRVRSPSWTTCT